jgi:hypothetical protein
MGPRAGLDDLEKRKIIYCSCQDSNPGPSSPQPSDYTFYAAPAPLA